MKLHLTQAGGKQLVNSYQTGMVTINQVKFHTNLILTPDKVFADWQVTNFDSITETSFTLLIDLKPELILLGTGQQHRFIHPKLIRNLTSQNIPVECMTTDAACRTYNILMSEGRNVIAALIL